MNETKLAKGFRLQPSSRWTRMLLQQRGELQVEEVPEGKRFIVRVANVQKRQWVSALSVEIWYICYLEKDFVIRQYQDLRLCITVYPCGNTEWLLSLFGVKTQEQVSQS